MPAKTAASPFGQFIPLILVFLIFYFLVFKPQKDKQKQHKEMVTNLKKNDKIVTSGGMHGTVVMVKDKSVVIRVDENVKIEFDKESISTIVQAKS